MDSLLRLQLSEELSDLFTRGVLSEVEELLSLHGWTVGEFLAFVREGA